MTALRITEEMFKSGKPIAQGEVLVWMKKYAPQSVIDGIAKLKNLEPMKIEKGGYILGHSETGHDHVLMTLDRKTPISMAALALIDAANDTYVELKLNQECEIVHLRNNDTHASFILPPGEYIRGIREEQSVQGWVRVAD